MRALLLALVLGCIALLGPSGCTRAAVAGESPQDETDVLYAARRGWPQDTSGGIAGVGTAKPTPGQSDPARAAAQARMGAIMRVLSAVRTAAGPGVQVTQSAFLVCIEDNAGAIHVSSETQDNGTVRFGIFIPKEQIQPFLDCISQQ